MRQANSQEEEDGKEESHLLKKGGSFGTRGQQVHDRPAVSGQRRGELKRKREKSQSIRKSIPRLWPVTKRKVVKEKEKLLF